MPPKLIRAEDAAGHRVVVTGLPGEEPASADVTSVKVVGRMADLRFSGHPTCGHFAWSYPRRHEFELNDKPKPKGVKR